MVGVDSRKESEKKSRSLAELFTRQLPRAVAMAYLMTGDRGVAEDLAQEAFIRLTGRFRHIRSPEAFDEYLRRTVVNLSLSHLRRRRVERAYLKKEGAGARPADHQAGLPDVATRSDLWALVQELPDRQRAAVVLRYYEDLSERRTAEVLKCSVAAVRSLVARAMETLRASVRGEQDG